MLEQRLVIPVIWRLFLPLVLGVICSFYSAFYPSFIEVLILFFSVVGLHLFSFEEMRRRTVLFGFFAMLFFFVLGAFLNGYHQEERYSTYFCKNSVDLGDVVQLRILEIPEVKENSVKVFAEVLALNQNKAIGKTLLYLEKDSAAMRLVYGDELLISAQFQEIRSSGNPKAFDYARYLKLQHIRTQAYVPSNQWINIGNSGVDWIKKLHKVRSYLECLLEDSTISPSNLMVAKALILGNKNSLDKETLRAYSSAGAMHVLAVSGLHVGIVMLILSFFLKPLKRFPRGKLVFLIVVLIGIWFYALLTGLSSSVLRSAIMFSFVAIGLELERETSVYQSIMVSAFLMVLIEPLVIFQVGFQLSYLAVIGIVYIQPKIYKLFYFRWLFIDKIWQITTVSIAAQLATFPLGLFYFHQFPNFFLLSNLIVIPLTFSILLVAFIYFLTHWIPIVNQVITYVFDALLSIMNKGVAFIEQLPYSIYYGVSIHWYEVFLIYAIIITGLVTLVKRKKTALFYTLTLAIILMGINIKEKNELVNEKVFVVYNTPKNLALDVFYGQKNVFYATSELMYDEDALQFNIKNNWFYRTGQASPTEQYLLKDSSHIIPIGQEKIWVTQHFPDSMPLTKYVLLHHLNFVPDEMIMAWKERGTIVLIGPSISSRLRYFLSSKLLPNQLHDLREDGAFQQSWN